VSARTLAIVGAGTLVALSACGGSTDLRADSPYQRFHSRPDLKPPTVRILARNRRASAGYVFIAPKKEVEQTGPLMLDNRGQVVWFLPVEAEGTTDFRVQRYRGRPVLTWWTSRPKDGDGSRRYTLYDNSYRLVTHVLAGNGLVGDMHEFTITARNSALMTFYRNTRLKGRKILEGGVQEVDIRTGRVLFQWNSLDHVRLLESYYRLPRDPSKIYDYFHINSVDVDHDGNLLISARNTHAVYKLHRRTGKVLWRLGGKRSDFELGKDVRFGWQHDARRQPDGTLTIFDNAAAPKLRKQSRGIVLRLDMKQMRATLVRSFVHRPPIVSVDQANMQRLPNDNVFIGWGHQPQFTEFGPRGKIVFDGRWGRGRMDSYRAYRFPWIGRPTSPPDVAVDGKTVYVSWNGATEVRKWQLLAGPEKNGLRPVRTVLKKRFETAIPLPGDPAWLAVRALDRRNRSLARSTAVRND
jgi:hypothetical protein